MNSTEGLQIIATAVIVSLLAPAVLAYLGGRQRFAENQQEAAQRSAEKLEDWAREDRVAAQASEAASLLLAANERVAQAANITNGKLDVIHTLVNSNMTAAMNGELDATVALYALLMEQPRKTAEAKEAVAVLKAKIDELRSALSDRSKAQDVVEMQEAQRTGVQLASGETIGVTVVPPDPGETPVQ